MSVVLLNSSFAQNGTEGKRLPETKHLDLPVRLKDSTVAVTKSPMPKIDLPEFVITGNAVIDLPGIEKQSATEDTQSSLVASFLNSPLTRSRETAQNAIGSKEEIGGSRSSLYSGNVRASLGTFFSPQAGLWFGKAFGDFFYSVDGQYYRTKGFAPFTDRSGGGVGLEGNTTLKSYNPYFDQSELHSELLYKTDTYNWYGTRIPSMARTRTDVALSADLSNWTDSPVPYTGDVGFESFEVDDSSRMVVETRVSLEGATRLMVASIPMNVNITAHIGSVSYGNSSAGLSYFDLMVGSQQYTWKGLSLEGSLHGYLASGMEDQTIVRLYPHLNVAYLLGDRHKLSLSYAPEVEAASLSSQVFENRYLASTSVIKHKDDQQDATLAIESGWSEGTSTKFAVRLQSITGYPLYADSLSQGVWLLAYGGRTTIASFSGEIFAKLPANDYFAAKFAVSLSNNSSTGNAIPYLPVFEVGASYTRQIASQWTGIARLTLIHQRKDNVVTINTLPSILLIGLRCEYQLFQQATMFLDVQNLLDQQYEYWRGYQESPFILSAGVSLRW